MTEAEKVLKCAMAAHNALVLYYKSNRNYSLVDWDEAPQWQHESTLAMVRSVVAGQYSARAEHERWLVKKRADGYVYGADKNDDATKGPLTNPDLLDYDELPVFSRMKPVIQIATILGTAANYDLVVDKVPELKF